jgi:hypothetical protein
MVLAKVNLKILTERVNRLLGTSHDEPYMAKVRQGNAGSAALRHVVAQETAAMLAEAADAAKAEVGT